MKLPKLLKLLPRQTVKAKRGAFTCNFCKFTFVMESRFIAHECKRMKRASEFKTPIGQAAWKYYDAWWIAKKRTPPPAQSFIDSRSYITFLNFAKFCNTVKLVNPDRFVKLMVLKDYEPSMWMTDMVYTQYMEYLDRRVDPLEQASTSIDTLFKLADRLGIDVSESFDWMDPPDLIELIRLRRLSPWLLLFSKKFNELFKRATPEQRVMIESLIRPEYWMGTFEDYPSEVSTIKGYLIEMGL